MLKSENVATPLAAVAVVVPESVPPLGLLRIATVTLCVAVGTVLPNASWITTCTAGAIAAPAVALLGWTVIASLVAAGGVGPSPHAATARTMAGAAHLRHARGPTRTVWTTRPP